MSLLKNKKAFFLVLTTFTQNVYGHGGGYDLKTIEPWLIAHIFLMFLSFAFLFPTGIFLGQYGSKAHSVVQAIGFFLMTLAFMLPIEFNTHTFAHSSHGKTGLLLVFVVNIQAITGATRKFFKLGFGTSAAHKFFAAFILCFIPWQIISGVNSVSGMCHIGKLGYFSPCFPYILGFYMAALPFFIYFPVSFSSETFRSESNITLDSPENIESSESVTSLHTTPKTATVKSNKECRYLDHERFLFLVFGMLLILSFCFFSSSLVLLGTGIFHCLSSSYLLYLKHSSDHLSIVCFGLLPVSLMLMRVLSQFPEQKSIIMHGVELQTDLSHLSLWIFVPTILFLCLVVLCRWAKRINAVLTLLFVCGMNLIALIPGLLVYTHRYMNGPLYLFITVLTEVLLIFAYVAVHHQFSHSRISP